MVKSASCPNFSVIIKLLLVIPAHTAEVERNFSVLKRIKNKLRNRLGSERLAQMIFIRFFLDDQNCDWDRVLHIFMNL